MPPCPGAPAEDRARGDRSHALEFETWRSLVRRQGLSLPLARKQAVDEMLRLVRGPALAASRRPKIAGLNDRCIEVTGLHGGTSR
jgi:hypothetical protein